MTKNLKKISNPSSTGGLGFLFETQIQASFIVLMITKSYSPIFVGKLIEKIIFQGKVEGYEIDDLIVELKDQINSTEHKLLIQIKHKMKIGTSNKFKEVISAAWTDFNSPNFNKGQDAIALITGPLSQVDIDYSRPIFEKARSCSTEIDFLTRINKAKYVSKKEREKYISIRTCLEEANGGKITDKEVFDFLRHFHLLGYDLDIRSGVLIALFQSFIGQVSEEDVESVWTRIVLESQNINKNGGTATIESIPENIKSLFNRSIFEEIPDSIINDSSIKPKVLNKNLTQDQSKTVSAASLVGSWDEKNPNDERVIKNLTDGL